MARAGALALLAACSLALAQQARLELDGKARLERSQGTVQSYSRSGGAPLSLSFDPGDRLCVTEGRGRLVYGVRAFDLKTPGAACFEVARPKGFWQSLAESCQDIGVCKKEAEKAFAKEAKSRGLAASAPALYLPADFGLPLLSLTVEGGYAVRLLEAGGRELMRLDVGSGGLFNLPAAALSRAARVEVLSRSEVALYSAPLRWVNLLGQPGEEPPKSPREAALRLLTTGQIGYAPAAYSYLLSAGDLELARVLEKQVRAEFRGVQR